MRRFEFASLQVTNLEASKEFYTNKLGFELAEMVNPDAFVFKYNKGEASFAIRKPLEDIEGKSLGIGVAVWFAIDEAVEDFRATVVEYGVEAGPIMPTPFGKAFHVKDPDGYKLTFLEPINTQ